MTVYKLALVFVSLYRGYSLYCFTR